MVIKNQDILKLCDQHLQIFKHAYPQHFIDFVKKMLNKGELDTRTVQVKHMLYYLGRLPEEINIYDYFIKLINYYYGMDQNILEIASGFIPAMAIKIHELQKLKNKGSIAVCDPVIEIEKLEGIKIIKEEFSTETNILAYDLLIGICLCEATIPTIINSLVNKKNFCLGLCGCIHVTQDEIKNHELSITSWLNYIYDKINYYLPADKELVVEDLMEQCNYEYPIILIKNKK